MKRTIYLLLLPILLAACTTKTDPFTELVASPNGQLVVSVENSADAVLGYSVTYKGQRVIDFSQLGFEFEGAVQLMKNLQITSKLTNSKNTIWETSWGEDHFIKDHYNELELLLTEANSPNRSFAVRFRVYDDGFGFRYEFLNQGMEEEVLIQDELTQFKLTGDHTAWWIPADYDSYEYHYTESKMSEIDSALYNERLAANTIMEKHAVNTPVTFKTEQGTYLSIHEANLTDYSGMTLNLLNDKRTFEASLVPSAQGCKVKRKGPFLTPWRTVQIGDSPGALMESKLILNLNEPSILEDEKWIRPAKYLGIWWEMHLKKSTWDYASGKHGATTEKAKKYIDFAAKHGFDGVLVEGWNTGWENWIDKPDREAIFDFITPYPDYDLKAVAAYAQEKGVGLVMHHETSAATRTYEQQLDTAYKLMDTLGIHYVKTGYVGPIQPEGEYHHGQYMVNHYRQVLKKAVEHEVMVIAHEPIKPTGLRRTYPHMMSREGVRGSEFNSPGGRGNPPEHLTIVPFTRGLAGPTDYTPGLFKLKLDEYSDYGYSVPTTLAHQLAEYVVVYSPVHMASDLIEHYEGHPAFQFIKDVPTDWEETRVIDAQIGEYVVVARLERNGYDWYLGGLTDENAREIRFNLDFLPKNVKYEAQIYQDAPDSHFQTNPEAYQVLTESVEHGDQFMVPLAPGGGIAIRFKAL